jgi:hypothetical protein
MRIIITDEGIKTIQNLSFTINKEKKELIKNDLIIKKNKSQTPKISRKKNKLLTIPKLNIFQNKNFKPINVPIPINSISLKIPYSKSKKKSLIPYPKNNKLIENKNETIIPFYSVPINYLKKKSTNIKLKRKKLILPKDQKMKYDISIGGKNLIIDEKELLINPEMQTDFSIGLNCKYSMKDIFGEKGINNLKKKFEKNKNDILIKRNFSFSNIRDDYNKRKLDSIRNFDKLMNKKIISIRKAPLLNYLYEKKNEINPLIIKNITNKNENNIDKLNKLCIKKLDEKDDFKYIKNVIKEKINEKKHKEILSFDENCDELKKKIKGFKELLKKYPTIKKKKIDYFGEDYYEYKHKYWKKFHIYKLEHKSLTKQELKELEYIDDSFAD